MSFIKLGDNYQTDSRSDQMSKSNFIFFLFVIAGIFGIFYSLYGILLIRPMSNLDFQAYTLLKNVIVIPTLIYFIIWIIIILIYMINKLKKNMR